MYVFIALWTAKPGWLALSRAQRSTFIEQVTTKMDTVVGDGFGALCWMENDADTARRAEFDYVGVWKMADEAMVRAFEDALTAAGWYDFFDQVNLRGTWSEPEDVLRRLMLVQV